MIPFSDEELVEPVKNTLDKQLHILERDGGGFSDPQFFFHFRLNVRFGSGFPMKTKSQPLNVFFYHDNLIQTFIQLPGEEFFQFVGRILIGESHGARRNETDEFAIPGLFFQRDVIRLPVRGCPLPEGLQAVAEFPVGGAVERGFEISAFAGVRVNVFFVVLVGGIRVFPDFQRIGDADKAADTEDRGTVERAVSGPHAEISFVHGVLEGFPLLDAGADLFLMPSKSEPCGLSQMIASRYGTVPIVRETGGLYDSIKPVGNGGNGFTFANYNAYDMLYVIREAINCYYNKEFWPQLVKRVMSVDFSWQRSAKEYEKVYGEMLK